MAVPALKIAMETSMEERVARLEANVGHIQSDVSETRKDIREMRQEIRQDIRRLDDKTDRLSQEVSSNFKWLLGAYGGGVLLTLGFVYFLVSRV